MTKEKIPENNQDLEKPIEIDDGRILVGGVWVDLIENVPDFGFDGEGHLTLNKKRFEEEREIVKKALELAIENGDRETFDKMTKGLAEASDDEHIDLYINLQKAFRDKNGDKLASINVDLLTDGIAQRNIIREGLKPQVEKLPFVFRDRNGNLLDLEEDIDVIFVKDKKGTYRLMIGSKKGIDSIEVPEKVDPSQFVPDFMNIEKDKATEAITIPLKPSRDGSESYVTGIEIRKGPIDLPKKVAREEAEEQAKKARKKKEEDSYYNPPPARSPRRSSESGGYGYVNVSG